MTGPQAPAEPPGPLVALATRARATGDPWLVCLEIAGLMTVLAVIVWLPNYPAFALPGLALSMFALWGIAEHVRLGRRRSRSRATRSAITGLQLLAVLAGTLAAAATLYAVVGYLVGTVVS